MNKTEVKPSFLPILHYSKCFGCLKIIELTGKCKISKGIPVLLRVFYPFHS